MKKKTETVLAIEHSKKVCDPQPEFIDRMEVRRLATNAYKSGYRKGRSTSIEFMERVKRLNLTDIDSPIFTHTEEFKVHFTYIIDKIRELIKEMEV